VCLGASACREVCPCNEQRCRRALPVAKVNVYDDDGNDAVERGRLPTEGAVGFLLRQQFLLWSSRPWAAIRAPGAGISTPTSIRSMPSLPSRASSSTV